MADVVVFGGSGFIGRPLLRALKRAKKEVVVAGTQVVPSEEDIVDGVKSVACDVRTPSRVEDVLGDYQPKAIVWLPARQGYKGDHSNFAKTQVAGTYSLFQAIDNFGDYKPERIVLASSQAVYKPRLLAEETSELDPPSVYGFSKLQQERAFTWFCERRGIACIALRYSIVVGPGQALHANENGLIRNWYRALKRNRHPEIYGNGEQIRDFVHVNDVTMANLQALSYPVSDVFNIGGYSASVLVAFLAWQQKTGCKDAKILGMEVRPGGEYSLTSNFAKAAKFLKWAPLLRLDQQIDDFLDKTKPSSFDIR